jgi:hypothetical protein
MGVIVDFEFALGAEAAASGCAALALCDVESVFLFADFFLATLGFEVASTSSVGSGTAPLDEAGS